jgi:outer membrane protein assembly factor BamB
MIRACLRIVSFATLSIAAVVAPSWSQNWPSFRGQFARGVADGQDLPVSWNVKSGENVLWKTPIPGMGHSSPVVWGDRVFVTTAVAAGEVGLVLGDEGGIDLSGDTQAQSWRVYCLDRRNGEILWSKELYSGEPRAKRHVKSSHANSTPATDGETVVAILGPQGMVALDMEGNERWRVDLGVLDPGLFGDPSSSWGHASSPVIDGDRVFVQVDRHSGSFLAAYDLANGEEIWQVKRAEKPIWATPTLHLDGERSQLIVLGGDFDRGYDPVTGEELWRFHRDLEVKTTTPIVADDLIILSGGYRGRPLYAVKSAARGDVSVGEGEKTGEYLAWTSEPGGPYTSTPVVYRDYIHFARNTGIVSVLALATGERVYRERLDSTYSASAVASDGKIYLTGEEGVVTVIKAGPEFEILGRSDMGEPCMATPAISQGALFIRTRGHLYSIGN